MWTSWAVLAACAVITQSFPRPDEYNIPDVPFGRRAQYYVLHDDGDFKYGYDTGSGAYESAVKMGSGDLTGFFGYDDAFGEKVRIDYTAGADGFRPIGNSIPVAPEVTQSAGSVATGANVLLKSAYVAPVATTPQRSFEESNVRSENEIDGSYSFSYDNSDSSRRESADSDNNVVGEYSFIADDGQNRQIRYRAGSATGYVAEGDSIPEAPEAAAIAPAPALPPATLYNAPVRAVPAILYSGPAASDSQQSFEPRGDASYSFSYDTDDSAREESSDRDLNVKGSFSFVADDGVRRNVNYIAGSSTGFVATGAHLPVAPEAVDPAEAGSGAGAFAYSAPAHTPQTYSAPSPIETSAPRGDASYQFTYQTDDSSRSETADRDLNVRGDYSFVADDGQRRTVNYVAGSSTGFLAYGAHLPVAPEVPATPVAPIAPSSPAVLYSAPQAHSVSTNEPRGDASYNFNYQGEGSSRSESSDSDLNVEGKYSFVADDGVERTVTYKAGSGIGFVVEGSHLPVAPVEGSDSASVQVSGSGSSAGTYSQASSFGSVPAFKTAQSQSANIASSTGAQGGYSFSYTNSDSSRSESADASNNVFGEYSFIADDGVNRKINYRAGSGIGFVAEGDSLPVAPEVPAVSAAQTYTASSQFIPAAAPVVAAPAPTTYSQAGSNIQYNIRQDGGYSFSYSNSDSSRSETADASNNVIGQYSFVADDGLNREIRYKAGAETGFVAEGDSLPVPPVAPVPAVYSVPAPSVSLYSAPVQTASVVSEQSFQPRGDASYSFSYQNDDSAREESADSDLNVKGRYSFVADDGQQRTVNYIAGSSTGFVANGDHLPVAPEAGAAISAQSSSVRATQYSGASSAASSSAAAASSAQTYSSGNDASYSFNYKNEDSSRDESADGNLNVKGRFSFVADDGVERSVNYIAGSSTGFVAEGAHLPVAPEISAVHDSGVSLSSAAAPSASQYSGSSASVSSSLASSGFGAQTYSAAGDRNDASYSFSYDNDDSARDESADANLNVRGHFKFIADDGVERTVNYIAGSDTGFVAHGAHLPVSVTVADGAVASVRSSQGQSGGFSASDSQVYTYDPPASPSTEQHSSFDRSSSGSIVGNVLLNRYGLGRSKFGYVFTEV